MKLYKKQWIEGHYEQYNEFKGTNGKPVFKWVEGHWKRHDLINSEIISLLKPMLWLLLGQIVTIIIASFLWLLRNK